MKPEEIRKLIRENFKTIAKKIDDDDGKLAYLSLSSKPEAIFRDEIGWMLQKELQEVDKNYVVAREYKRYDLAVLKLSENEDDKECEELHHLVELKVIAAGAFRDELKVARDFVQSIEDDFNKRIESDIDVSKITSLVITYGVNDEIPNNKYAFVKYAGRHNALFKKDYDNSEEYELIQSRIDGLLNKGSKSDYNVEGIDIAEANPLMNIRMNLYGHLITQSN